jgi:hypothetical protein
MIAELLIAGRLSRHWQWRMGVGGRSSADSTSDGGIFQGQSSTLTSMSTPVCASLFSRSDRDRASPQRVLQRRNPVLALLGS